MAADVNDESEELRIKVISTIYLKLFYLLDSTKAIASLGDPREKSYGTKRYLCVGLQAKG